MLQDCSPTMSSHCSAPPARKQVRFRTVSYGGESPDEQMAKSASWPTTQEDFEPELRTPDHTTYFCPSRKTVRRSTCMDIDSTTNGSPLPSMPVFFAPVKIPEIPMTSTPSFSSDLLHRHHQVISAKGNEGGHHRKNEKEMPSPLQDIGDLPSPEAQMRLYSPNQA